MEFSQNVDIPVKCGDSQKLVYSIRFPDEMVFMLNSSKEAPQIRLRLDLEEPSNNLLMMNGSQYKLISVKETQPVDVIGFPKTRQKDKQYLAQILGQVKGKFTVRQELEQGKMDKVRQQTEEAEKVRLSRKTVTIDSDPKVNRRAKKAATTWNSPIMRKSYSTGTLPRQRNSVLSKDISNSEKETLDVRSQNSWSPELTDAHVFNGSAAVSHLSFKPDTKPSLERRQSDKPLIPPVSPSSSTKANAFYQLEEEFGRRYREYQTLNQWVDSRLAVFTELQRDLDKEIDNKSRDQLIFKVVVEENRLKSDQEYQDKMERLEECCAALMMIKSRMNTLMMKTPT